MGSECENFFSTGIEREIKVPPRSDFGNEDGDYALHAVGIFISRIYW